MLLLLLSLLWIINAHAIETTGYELGNGGDAIVCDNGRVLFYDVYESEHRFGLAPMFPPGANEYEIAKQIVDRVRTLSPMRAEGYRQWIEQFNDNAQFINDVRLIDIPDTNGGFIPAHCQIEQLLIQREPKFSFERRFVVNNDLWARLPITHRAAALVHEMLLREGRIYGLETSESIRFLNAHFLSAKLRNFPTAKDWVVFLEKVIEFNMTDYDGIWIRTKTESDGTSVGPTSFDEFTGEVTEASNEGDVPFRSRVISIPWILDADFQQRYRRTKFASGAITEIDAKIQFASGIGLDGLLEQKPDGTVLINAFTINYPEAIQIKVTSGVVLTNTFQKLYRRGNRTYSNPVRVFSPGIPEELSSLCGQEGESILKLNDKKASYIKLDNHSNVLQVKFCED